MINEVRTLTIHFKVPKNVEVRTIIEKTGETLPLVPMEQLKRTPNFVPISNVQMDLTTARAANWLNASKTTIITKMGSTADNCTCCVRG